MSPLFAVSTTQSVAMLVVAASVAAALWWSQRSARRVSQPRAMPAQTKTAAPADRPDDLRRWEIEMHELARSLTADVNMRVAVLQQLLISAEAESARLKRLLEQTAQAAPGNQPSPSADRADPPHSKETRPRVAPRRDEILELARLGASLSEIAARTGAPPGEIDLVLGLRRAAREN